MADYYPLLARALDGLSENTGAARQGVYERAATALIGQLRAVQPPLGEAEIARERASLEEAIARAERAYAATETGADQPDGGRVEEHDERVPERHRPRPPERTEKGGSRRVGLVAAGLAALMVPIAVVAWLWRDQPAPAEPPTPAGGQNEAPPSSTDPKYPGRVAGGGGTTGPERPAGGGTGSGPDRPGTADPGRPPSGGGTPPAGTEVAVAQRAALVEENTADPQQPKLTQGRAFWRLDNANAGQGQPLETVVRATVDIPDAALSLQLVMRKNRDATLPASHTIELVFASTRPTDPDRNVRDVNPPLFRADDGNRGVPVAALSVPVKENVFLIGLSNLRTDMDRNAELIRNRTWIEIPVRFASGLRATLVFEKGVTGDRVLADAFTAWAQP